MMMMMGGEKDRDKQVELGEENRKRRTGARDEEEKKTKRRLKIKTRGGRKRMRSCSSAWSSFTRSMDIMVRYLFYSVDKRDVHSLVEHLLMMSHFNRGLTEQTTLIYLVLQQRECLAYGLLARRLNSHSKARQW